jgi:hypothetical protein
VTVNDVAVRYSCHTLDPTERRLVPKEVRGRYVTIFVCSFCMF